MAKIKNPMTIVSSGGSATLVPKTITANGQYNPSDDNADGYSDVSVSVDAPAPVLISKSITQNGTYDAQDDNADGYSDVTVDVPIPVPTLKTKTITENGTFSAQDDNADGYSEVTVAVPVQPSKFTSLVDKTIKIVTADDLFGIATIGDNAFYNCQYLTFSEIPNGVTEIKRSCFQECTKLKFVTFPASGLTTIDHNALYYCLTMQTIVVPSSVTTVKSNAFNYCIGLQYVAILATTPPSLFNANAFSNTNNCPIYVPAASVNDYKTETNWSALESRIFPIVSVSTAADLLAVATACEGGNTYENTLIYIANDIDMTGTGFNGLGTSTNPFMGNIYGGGHTVTLDQTFTGTQKDSAGLIQYLAIPDGGNITIQNVKVSGTIDITPSSLDSCDTHGGLITATRSGTTGNGDCALNILDCVSSVRFETHGTRVGIIGGFIGWVGHQDGYLAPLTVNIDGCVWDGVINAGSAISDTGGFIGNTGLNKSGRTVTINIISSEAKGKIQLNVAWSDNCGLFIGNQKCNFNSGTTTVNVRDVVCTAYFTSSVTLNSENWFAYFNKQTDSHGVLNLQNFYYKERNAGGFNPIPLTPASGGAPTTQRNVAPKTDAEIVALTSSDFTAFATYYFYNDGTRIPVPVGVRHII